jgi:hypothetical protein
MAESYHERRHAERMRDPEFREAYEAARAEIEGKPWDARAQLAVLLKGIEFGVAFSRYRSGSRGQGKRETQAPVENAAAAISQRGVRPGRGWRRHAPRR